MDFVVSNRIGKLARKKIVSDFNLFEITKIINKSFLQISKKINYT